MIATLIVRQFGGAWLAALQADSAELALKWSLPLLVIPAFKRGGGTWVGHGVDSLVGERSSRSDG